MMVDIAFPKPDGTVVMEQFDIIEHTTCGSDERSDWRKFTKDRYKNAYNFIKNVFFGKHQLQDVPFIWPDARWDCTRIPPLPFIAPQPENADIVEIDDDEDEDSTSTSTC
jgi:hypothetical protein